MKNDAAGKVEAGECWLGAKKKKRIRRSEADAMFGRSIDRLNQCNQAATRIEETSDGGREASSRKEKEGEREGEGKR